MTTFIVNLLGVLIIFFIIAWFWARQKKRLTSKQSAAEQMNNKPIEITVADGVYHPDIIYASIKNPIELHFYRKDSTPCAETVIFDQLHVSQALPLNQVQPIILDIKEPGEYEFTCQMGMYRGRLIVSE